MRCVACTALATCLVACSDEPERVLYTGGHADIALELVVEDGEASWDARLSAVDSTIDGERVSGALSLEDVAIASSARFARPAADSGAFDPLCIEGGAHLAWLPQGLEDARRADAPFLGISATADPEALESGGFDIRLRRVESPSGAGVYSLWRDGFPPEFPIASCDGIDDADMLAVPLGHDHYNMGFTETGEWTVTYEAVARLASGDVTALEFRVHYVLE
ncbi:MAG: hypothetical protein OXT09_27740 [Myxococcales bacterium]|nr:hypothetical protein [Myxococcales bacterium]